MPAGSNTQLNATNICTTPNNPYMEDIWGMSQIDAPEAWDISYTHVDLDGNITIGPRH